MGSPEPFSPMGSDGNKAGTQRWVKSPSSHPASPARCWSEQEKAPAKGRARRRGATEGSEVWAAPHAQQGLRVHGFIEDSRKQLTSETKNNNNCIFLYIRERVLTLKSQWGPTGLSSTPGAATPWDQHRDPSLGVQPPPCWLGTQPSPRPAKLGQGRGGGSTGEAPQGLVRAGPVPARQP